MEGDQMKNELGADNSMDMPDNPDVSVVNSSDDSSMDGNAPSIPEPVKAPPPLTLQKEPIDTPSPVKKDKDTDSETSDEKENNHTLAFIAGIFIGLFFVLK